MSTSRKVVKAVAALAAKCGLTFNKDSLQLANKQVAISILYAGGMSLSRLINEECALHFAQCGSDGQWLAVLPAEDLMRLLETESVYKQFQERKAANG